MKIIITFLFLLIKAGFINAQTWDSVGTGIDGTPSSGSVRALIAYNGELYAGGSFNFAGGISANSIAKWDGINWGAMTTGAGIGVNTLVEYNNNIFAGGNFTPNFIKMWDGTQWLSVGSLGDVVSSIVVYNGELYAAGYFNNAHGSYISKWDGNDWLPLTGGGTNGLISSLIVYNGELYAGGFFTTAGGNSTKNIAKWNGTNWSSVSEDFNSAIWSLSVYNNELFAGGYFTKVGNLIVPHIAKWNGINWSTVGGGIDTITPSSSVNALCSFNNELFAGGLFTSADGNPASNIAKWNGINWSSLSGGVDSKVYSLCVYNNELYVGGDFSYADGIATNRIARWNPLSIDIKENSREEKAQFYPNPFSSSTTLILTKEQDNSTLSIYDMYGKKVRCVSFNGNQTRIEKQELVSGVYFYEVDSNNEVVASGKIVIQ